MDIDFHWSEENMASSMWTPQAIALTALIAVVAASNPLVPRVGMADTNVHYFDGKFAIFATHDFSINNTVSCHLKWLKNPGGASACWSGGYKR
jgi:hypothetical protein